MVKNKRSIKFDKDNRVILIRLKKIGVKIVESVLESLILNKTTIENLDFIF